MVVLSRVAVSPLREEIGTSMPRGKGKTYIPVRISLISNRLEYVPRLLILELIGMNPLGIRTRAP